MDFKASDGGLSLIEIRVGTDSWGPYEVDFTGAIPNDQVIVGVNIKAYSGKADKKTDPTLLQDITDLLIESAETTINATKVGFKLQFPGLEYHNTKATLVFEITTSSEGKYPFFFYPVNIF